MLGRFFAVSKDRGVGLGGGDAPADSRDLEIRGNRRQWRSTPEWVARFFAFHTVIVSLLLILL